MMSGCGFAGDDQSVSRTVATGEPSATGTVDTSPTTDAPGVWNGIILLWQQGPVAALWLTVSESLI